MIQEESLVKVAQIHRQLIDRLGVSSRSRFAFHRMVGNVNATGDIHYANDIWQQPSEAALRWGEDRSNDSTTARLRTSEASLVLSAP